MSATSIALRGVCPAILAFVTMLSHLARADVASWNGSMGNWSEAARWSTNPIFPNNGGTTYDVLLGGGIVSQDVAGGVTLDSLTWTGGTLAGAESVTVLNSVIWSDGSLANSGGLIVPVGSLLTYTGNSTQHKLDNFGKLVVGGTFRLVGVSDLNTSAAVATGAAVDVLGGATFDIQGDGNLSDTFFDNFGQVRKGTVTNAGLFTKTSGSGTSLVTDDWTFNNLAGGVVNVSSGTLRFSRNGNGFNNAGQAQVTAGTLRVGGGTSTGTFNVAAGGTLLFVTSSSPSIVQVLDGATINNSGTLQIDGHVRFENGALITGNRTLSLIGDDAEISGSAPITLDNFNWSAGRLANSGGLSVATGGTMTISGSGSKQLANNARLSIAGNATFGGTQSIVNLATPAAAARVEVLPGGVLDVQADIGLAESPTTPGNNAGTFVNDGTFRKSAGNGNSDVSVDWTVTNNGSIQVSSGAIRFFGNVTHTGVVALDGGNVEFRANVSGPGNFTGGGLATFRRDYRPGTGPASVSFGGDLRFDSSLATLYVELGGKTAGTQYDQLLVDGSAMLTGTLRVGLADLGGGIFAPQNGDTFQILTANGGISGSFATVLPSLTPGLIWKVMQSANSLELTVKAFNGLVGDYNQNGVVDAADYTLWRDTFGQNEGALAADGNGDHKIDDVDYGIWKSHFGESTPTPTGSASVHPLAVPEPTSNIIFVSALILLCLYSARTSTTIKALGFVSKGRARLPPS